MPGAVADGLKHCDDATKQAMSCMASVTLCLHVLSVMPSLYYASFLLLSTGDLHFVYLQEANAVDRITAGIEELPSGRAHPTRAQAA